MIGGLLGVSGGGGLSASTSGGTSGTGDQERSSGNTWNFAPPQYQVQANQQQMAGQQWSSVALVGGVLVVAWLFTRKR